MINFVSAKLLRQIWRCYRDFGADETLCRILNRLKLFSSVHSLDFYMKELGETEANSSPSPDNFREISREEMTSFRVAEGMPPRQEFQKQFDRGSRLFAALKRDEVIAVNWTSTLFADLAHIRRPHVPLQKKMVYTYGLIVSPLYRKQGVAVSLKQFILRMLACEGFQLIFLAVFLKNVKISRWHKKNGFIKWGRVFNFHCFGKDFWWTRLTSIGKKYPHLLTG